MLAECTFGLDQIASSKRTRCRAEQLQLLERVSTTWVDLARPRPLHDGGVLREDLHRGDWPGFESLRNRRVLGRCDRWRDTGCGAARRLTTVRGPQTQAHRRGAAHR